jgi:hypothetical protein
VPFLAKPYRKVDLAKMIRAALATLLRSACHAGRGRPESAPHRVVMPILPKESSLQRRAEPAPQRCIPA